MRKKDKALILNDLTASYKKFGIGDLMEEMKGKEFEISHTGEMSVSIPYKGHAFTFSKNDVQIICSEDLKPLKTKDPEVFDPQHLVLD